MCAQECRLCYCGIFSGYLFETGGIHLCRLRYLSVLIYAHDILDPPCPSLKGRELSSPFSGPPKISDFGVSFGGDRGGLSNQIQFGAGNRHAGCLPFVVFGVAYMGLIVCLFAALLYGNSTGIVRE